MQPHISSLASTDSSINQVEVLRACEELIKQFERINHKQFEVKWRHSQGLGLVENYNYNPFRKSLVLQTSNSCKPSKFSIISLAHLTKLLELSEVDNEFFQVCINGSPFQHTIFIYNYGLRIFLIVFPFNDHATDAQRKRCGGR